MMGPGMMGGGMMGGPLMGGPMMGPGMMGGGMMGGPMMGRGMMGGPGRGGRFKKAAVVAALLLDGPADAAEVVKRVSKASNGAIKPPKERVELVLSMLSGRGVVTLDNGVATLTELGRNLLAFWGMNADSARGMLAQAEKFADVAKIRRELRATAELARTITWTGTAAQKKTLKEAKASILAAIKEAKRSLHEALAEDSPEQSTKETSPSAGLDEAELQVLRALLAKLTQ